MKEQNIVKKFLGTLMVSGLLLLSACSITPIGAPTGEGSVFDETINSDEEQANSEIDAIETEIEELPVYEKMDYNDAAHIYQTALSKEVGGYFVGTYHAEVLDKGQTTIVFVDGLTEAHLDLLEIEHEVDQWVSDVTVTDDFKTVRYDLTMENSSVEYVHELATGVTVEAKDYKEAKSELELVNTEYDLVLANGVVIDPVNEAYMFGYDVGIIDGEIVTITDQTLVGAEVIDTTGLMVSPGFIDTLTFNLSDIGAKYKITDGVTSGLSNHGCSDNFDSFFANYGNIGSYVNYGGAIFAIRIRWDAGLDNHGKPTEAQIEFMADRVREEIEAGGIALAFSPEYYPGTTPEEIKAMMAVAAEYDIPTHFHARYSSVTGEHTGIEGVEEVLAYARELDAKVQFMHLHSTGGTGMMDEALTMINEARADGVEVTYDIYPYDSWASNIEMARFDEGWQQRYNITYSDLQMAGTNVRLTEKTFNELREGDGGLCVAYAMDEKEMLMALSEEYAMVGSDGCIEYEEGGNDHFRGAGTFSRILGKYVRDENAFSLMDGIQKMTINNAAHFEDISEAMALRGRMEEGCIADITVFDYRTVLDQSNAQYPATQSKGIEYVVVSGQVGVRKGELVKSVRAGAPIASNYREE